MLALETDLRRRDVGRTRLARAVARGAITADRDPIRQPVFVTGEERMEQAREAEAWLRDHGWSVVVHEKNMRPALEQAGWRYAPSIDHSHWADLVSLSNPDFIVENYGSGASIEDAIVSAKRRYGSEQT